MHRMSTHYQLMPGKSSKNFITTLYYSANTPFYFSCQVSRSFNHREVLKNVRLAFFIAEITFYYNYIIYIACKQE